MSHCIVNRTLAGIPTCNAEYAIDCEPNPQIAKEVYMVDGEFDALAFLDAYDALKAAAPYGRCS